MEDFKNIITLLNNPDTLELGATLAVSQGLGEKIKSLYKIKQTRQVYKYRIMKTEIFDINKCPKPVFNVKKNFSKSKRILIDAKRRIHYGIVFNEIIKKDSLIAENNRIKTNPNSNPLIF